MPGPIFTLVLESGRGQATAADHDVVHRIEMPVYDAPRVDPMNLAAYGISRPHVDGKMAPPEKHVYPDVWAKKRRRR